MCVCVCVCGGGGGGGAPTLLPIESTGQLALLYSLTKTKTDNSSVISSLLKLN